MFTKPISSLEFEDIHDIVVHQKLDEGHHLDYKERVTPVTLTKLVSGFANSAGGYLILGVTDKKEIVGVEPQVDRHGIAEWINQILSSNIDPQINYLDPKVIPIPETNKVVVVLHVPESSKKPHFANNEHCYYIRLNDSTKKANHNHIRDMFELTRNRSEEVKEFLKKRNLYDAESSAFGLNIQSAGLQLDGKKPANTQPRVIFSLVPKYVKGENVKFSEVSSWIDKNYKDYPPVPGTLLLYPQLSETMLEGVVFKDTRNSNSPFYFEINESGYVESGLCRSIFFNDNNRKLMALTMICGYEIMFLHFAKRFYNFIKMYEEVMLQVSFCNINGFELFDFHSEKHNYMLHIKYVCVDRQNFALHARFNPSDLNEASINSNVHQHSEKICRAFGLSQEAAFGKDGNIDIRAFNNFHL